MEKLKRVVIKQELVQLTGDFRKALILNQFIYWAERVKDSDKWLKEEKARAKVGGIEINILESKGWIYKTAEELNEELMINLSMPTMRKLLKELIESGYINSRRNPKYNWDKTLQYRVDLVKVQSELMNIGYGLEGYPLLGKEDKEKAPTFGEVEADENKNSIDNNSICNKDNNNTSSTKNKVENVANKLTEVEKAIKESNVNIRKEDLKECNETFTNIDVLVKALGLVESDRGHGIKALRGAYKKVMGLVTPSNKGYLNNNDMMIDGKKLTDYDEEEFNKMVEEKQKVFKPTFTNTPKVEGTRFI